MNTLPLSLDAADRGGGKRSVECLGHVFESDQARREHYLSLLAEKLKDPEFRKTPGFPKGTDEAILRMSDPPYYTACPNPFLEEFVRYYRQPHRPETVYDRESFAVNISVGKTDPLYKAHSYHTKVPHLAIVPSILHYTEPGDVVLDSFCGSGMTGVASQWCDTAPISYRQKIESEWKQLGRRGPKWGPRRVILGDLGPAATFIAANYNIPFDVSEVSESARNILDEVAEELGWMYETLHTDGITKGRINYTVWSEIFTCQECSRDMIFLNEALDPDTRDIRGNIKCPHCRSYASKEQMDLRFESFWDASTNTIIRRPIRVPVMINYSVNSQRYEKELDSEDLGKITKISQMNTPTNLPMVDLPDCQMTRVGRMRTTNTKSIHHMFLPRSSQAVSALWSKADRVLDARTRQALLFFFEQSIAPMSILNRYRPKQGSQSNQVLNGVYYVPSQIAEISPIYRFAKKLNSISTLFSGTPFKLGNSCITTSSSTSLSIPNGSVDYIFTDPPFGENIYYADLNFLIESWHGVWTSSESESIVDRVRDKGAEFYQQSMCQCFRECYRVLKFGRWMTVVFSNSKNAIWRSIQEAIGIAGFVIADISMLDKRQGSFRQVTSSAVKQDLIISAYKPTEALETAFELGSATVDDAWRFISEHLSKIMIFLNRAGQDAEVIAERTPQMLYDRMVAFFVQHRLAVPISGSDFFAGLDQHYQKRDGMYFLSSQIPEYDRRRTTVSELRQLHLFVQDEASATQWIRQRLQSRPQTFQDLQPQFMQQIQAWAKHEKTIELKDILNLNFLCYDGDGAVPSQIHSYLSTNFKLLRNRDKDDGLLKAKALYRWYVPDTRKEGDLERLRTRAMLREFDEYRVSTQGRIRQFRTEAVRIGFKHCYDEQDYRTIVDVARKLPTQVVHEDEKLLMYYDVAMMRLGDTED